MTEGALPMFPLQSVHFPSSLVPLHVFEPRYRALVRECLDGDRRFGTVLIERGSEVGGGDRRLWVGTELRIVEALPLDDGRWVLAAVGLARIRVVRWLPDDPYPRALVADLPDLPAGDRARSRLEAAARLLRRCLALQAELGEARAPATVELADDPDQAAWQAAALAPIGPVDAQRLLEADGTDRRLELLVTLLGEQADLLARLVTGR